MKGYNGTKFKGFLVEARLMADDDTNVGTFAVDPDEKDTRLSSCSPDTVSM